LGVVDLKQVISTVLNVDHLVAVFEEIDRENWIYYPPVVTNAF